MLINRLSRPLLTLCALIGLQGCSPHPGSGSWVPVENSETIFSLVTIDFNGRAELFIPKRDDHLYRCFWAGQDSKTLSLDCIAADDDTLKPQLLFRISQEGVADLLEADKLLGQFKRSDDQSRHTE